MYTRVIVLIVLIINFSPSFSQSLKFKKGVKAFEANQYEEAFTYLKPFAEGGDASAQLMVGICYLDHHLKEANDSIAIHYLLKSAIQKNVNAMSLLTELYYKQSYSDRYKIVDAYVWAEIGSAYDVEQRKTTIRHFLKSNLSESEFKDAFGILTTYKKQLDQINLSYLSSKEYDHSFGLSITPTQETGLIDEIFNDWIYRWKRENFQCDTFYYTETINPVIIDSTINIISKNTQFRRSSDRSNYLQLTTEEQIHLIEQLKLLKEEHWTDSLLPKSKMISLNALETTLAINEKLPSENAKNSCSIIYTFSKPLFLREKSIALFLNQKTYRTNYTQLSFSFYTFENEKWYQTADVYVYFESAR